MRNRVAIRGKVPNFERDLFQALFKKKCFYIIWKEVIVEEDRNVFDFWLKTTRLSSSWCNSVGLWGACNQPRVSLHLQDWSMWIRTLSLGGWLQFPWDCCVLSYWSQSQASLCTVSVQLACVPACALMRVFVNACACVCKNERAGEKKRLLVCALFSFQSQMMNSTTDCPDSRLHTTTWLRRNSGCRGQFQSRRRRYQSLVSMML